MIFLRLFSEDVGGRIVIPPGIRQLWAGNPLFPTADLEDECEPPEDEN
jgi:hypothetical protein